MDDEVDGKMEKVDDGSKLQTIVKYIEPIFRKLRKENKLNHHLLDFLRMHASYRIECVSVCKKYIYLSDMRKILIIDALPIE